MCVLWPAGGTRTAMTDYIMAMAGQEAQHETHSDTTAPLAGIRVLEFCHTIMGPTAGLILADLGADVIKVEPAGGDSTRKLLGFAAGFFATFNRNKRSIAVDLKSGDGRALLHRLAATADVVLENYAPGTMDRLGRGYADFSKLNPRLIYCALKGFLSGPYEHRPALDEVVQFMAGLAYMTGPPGQPLRAGSSVVDIMGGMFAVIGIQAALRERERTGRGQMIKSALFESTAFLMAQHMAGQAVTGRAPPPMPLREGAWAIYEPFATRDGEQIFVGLTSDRQWRRFCEHFGRQDQRGSRPRAPGAQTAGGRNRRPSYACRACRTVRPHRYSVCAGRQARRPVRRSTAQCRRPHARHRLSQWYAGQNSAAAGRDRRPRSGAAPPGARDRRAHRRDFSRARPCSFRDRGARPPRHRHAETRGLKRRRKHERSAETRAYQRGRPARGLSVRERRYPDRAQDRADRRPGADRPRPDPDRLVRQSQGGARHGRRRGRGARHHAKTRRRLYGAVAQRQGLRARAAPGSAHAQGHDPALRVGKIPHAQPEPQPCAAARRPAGNRRNVQGQRRAGRARQHHGGVRLQLRG